MTTRRMLLKSIPLLALAPTTGSGIANENDKMPSRRYLELAADALKRENGGGDWHINVDRQAKAAIIICL